MLISVQTPAAGGTAYAQFAAQWCQNGNGYLLNDTGTSLDVKIGAAASPITVANGKGIPFKLVYNCNELFVRRTDQATAQVTVEAQVGIEEVPSDGGGTSGPVAAADITDAGTAGIAALQAETQAQLRAAAGLAGLSTTGIVARTGTGTAATRTITGTANQITVTNGDGVAGNLTLSLPQNIAESSTPTFAGLSLGTRSGVKLSTYRDGAGGDIGFGINLSGVPSGWEHSIYAGGPSDTYGRISFGRRRGDTGTYTERMVVNVASGYVGIGTGTPSALLHVSGGNVRFSNYGAGTLVTDSSGNITASSDSSLKTVTGSFTRGLADVLKLTPRTYHWNEKSGMDTEDENVGFIAQEVLESIPEAVGQYRTSEVEVDGKKIKKREKAELLTLSDRPLIAALVNAVKELKAENDELRKRLDRLETKK